jgi:hypothetical protein
LEQDESAPEYATIHKGLVRKTLSKYSYYISPFGLIMNDKEDNYSLGDIRYTHGLRKLLIGKEEVILSKEGIEGKSRLVWLLLEKGIPFREAKVKKIKINAQTPQLAVQD